jgi:hypothetical protein
LRRFATQKLGILDTRYEFMNRSEVLSLVVDYHRISMTKRSYTNSPGSPKHPAAGLSPDFKAHAG